MGTTEVEPWMQTQEHSVVSTHLPLCWGRRLSHDDCIPVIRDLWQTRGQELLPWLHKAIHTNTQRSVNRTVQLTQNCHLVVWWKFFKKKKVQSKFLLWKTKKCLPRKKYYQGMSLTDLFQENTWANWWLAHFYMPTDIGNAVWKHFYVIRKLSFHSVRMISMQSEPKVIVKFQTNTSTIYCISVL